MTELSTNISKDPDVTLAALGGVGGTGQVSARQDASNLLVSKGPDVLWTPKGGGKVAVAYSVIAPLDPSTRLSMSVRDNDNYDFQLNSRTTTIQGHEAGTLKGVKVQGYKKYSHVETASNFVYSEGFATVSHRDPAWINHDDPGPTETCAALELRGTIDPATGRATSGNPNVNDSIVSNSNPMKFTGFSSPATSTDRDFDPKPMVPSSLQERRSPRSPLSSKDANARAVTIVGATKRMQTLYFKKTSSDQDLSFQEKSPSVMKDLKDRYGITTYQAAGILGSLGTESDGFIAYHQYGSREGKGGYGYGQWTFPSRRSGFFKYAKDNNLDPRSDEASFGYLHKEVDPQLTNDKKRGASPVPLLKDSRSIAVLRASKNRQSATKNWSDIFESPGVANMQDRQNYAKEAEDAYLQRFGGD